MGWRLAARVNRNARLRQTLDELRPRERAAPAQDLAQRGERVRTELVVQAELQATAPVRGGEDRAEQGHHPADVFRGHHVKRPPHGPGAYNRSLLVARPPHLLRVHAVAARTYRQP